MPRYRAHLCAPVSADEAFDYLADFSNAVFWDPSVRQARRLDQGPLRQGSEFALTISFLGGESTLEYRITRFEPGHLVRLEAENAFIRSVDTLTFHSDGGGSSVGYDAELSTKGLGAIAVPILALAFPRLGRAAENGLQERLSELVEQTV